jgi:hypothetical protein
MVPNGTSRVPRSEDDVDTAVTRLHDSHTEFGLGEPARGSRAEPEHPDATARYDEAFMVKVARELERGELPTVRPPPGAGAELDLNLNLRTLNAGERATPREPTAPQIFPGWREPMASVQNVESQNHHEPAKTQSRGTRALHVVLSVVLVAVVSFVVAVACAAGPEWRMAQVHAFFGLLGR